MAAADKIIKKSEETSEKILNAALDLFRTEGFEKATMRDTAQAAGVATGAAYYYYDSKDAIVMDFYKRAWQAMQPKLAEALQKGGLEARLLALIEVKLNHFRDNRGVLRALLKNGADPQHPLSPFSAQTRDIRDGDIAWFQRILVDCGIRIPRDLEKQLPRVLWFYQMGVIYFWVTDDSEGQSKTAEMLKLSARIVTTLARLSAVPLVRPLRTPVLRLIELITGE